MRKRSFPKGVSLIELTVALAMFSIIMVIAVDSFNSVLKVSRESTQRQAIQDHAEFLFSLMTKEIKFAKVNYDNKCDAFFSDEDKRPNFKVGNNQLYAVDALKKQDLRFINYKGECVRYFLSADASANNISRLRVERYDPKANDLTKFQTAWVTPLAINVKDLFFEVNDIVSQQEPSTSRTVPSVAYYLKLESTIWNPPTVDYFNYVSARNIEQF